MITTEVKGMAAIASGLQRSDAFRSSVKPDEAGGQTILTPHRLH